MKTPKLNPALIAKVGQTVAMANAYEKAKKAEKELADQLPPASEMPDGFVEAVQTDGGNISVPSEILKQIENATGRPVEIASMTDAMTNGVIKTGRQVGRTAGLQAIAEQAAANGEILRTVDKAPNVTAFALDVAQRSRWPANDVQVWLDYLDSIRFDYVGLGVQNCVALLPHIVQTAKFVEAHNLAKSTEARNALILKALEDKTRSALDRLKSPGNRQSRRAAKHNQFEKSQNVRSYPARKKT